MRRASTHFGPGVKIMDDSTGHFFGYRREPDRPVSE